MTLEELSNKKITINVNKTFKLSEDLDVDSLETLLEDSREFNWLDNELLNKVIETYYCVYSDIEDILDMDDYKVTIHD